MSLLYECASSRRTRSQDVARLSGIRAWDRQDLEMVAECSRHLVLSIDDLPVPLKRAFLAAPAIHDGHFEGEETTMNYPESQRRGLLPNDDLFRSLFRTKTRRQSGKEEEEEEQLASAATCVRGARSSATTTCRTIA